MSIKVELSEFITIAEYHSNDISLVQRRYMWGSKLWSAAYLAWLLTVFWSHLAFKEYTTMVMLYEFMICTHIYR